MKTVTDTRLAIDGNAGSDKVRDVAVYRPLGNLQLLGQLPRRLDAFPSKKQKNLEKSVCTSHGTSLPQTSCQRDGNNMPIVNRANLLLTGWCQGACIKVFLTTPFYGAIDTTNRRRKRQ